MVTVIVGLGPGGLRFEPGYTQESQSLSCSGIPGIQTTNPNQIRENVHGSFLIRGLRDNVHIPQSRQFEGTPPNAT